MIGNKLFFKWKTNQLNYFPFTFVIYEMSWNWGNYVSDFTCERRPIDYKCTHTQHQTHSDWTSFSEIEANLSWFFKSCFPCISVHIENGDVSFETFLAKKNNNFFISFTLTFFELHFNFICERALPQYVRWNSKKQNFLLFFLSKCFWIKFSFNMKQHCHVNWVIDKKLFLLSPLKQNFTSFLLDLSSNPHNEILKIWL